MLISGAMPAQAGPLVIHCRCAAFSHEYARLTRISDPNFDRVCAQVQPRIEHWQPVQLQLEHHKKSARLTTMHILEIWNSFTLSAIFVRLGELQHPGGNPIMPNSATLNDLRSFEELALCQQITTTAISKAKNSARCFALFGVGLILAAVLFVHMAETILVLRHPLPMCEKITESDRYSRSRMS